MAIVTESEYTIGGEVLDLDKVPNRRMVKDQASVKRKRNEKPNEKKFLFSKK